MPHRVKVYPHNDLLNLAYYHREIINNKIKENIDDAIALDCMSFIIAVAFGIEAFINFIGSQKVDQWGERKPFYFKVQKIYKAIGGNFDRNNEPYKTILLIKGLRDTMAHGKPIDKTVEIRSSDELWVEMCTPWDHCLDEEFVNKAFEQVQLWKNELLQLSNIQIQETITSFRNEP